MIISEKIKKDFPIFSNNPDLAYLDSAASSQTPEPVLQAMLEYYTTYRANIHRGIYRESKLATDEYAQARKEVAVFINADEKEIIFTGGATISSNMLAASLEHAGIVTHGDEIVASIMEHHANFLPWQEFASRRKAVFTTIPLRTNLFSIDYAFAEKIITHKTKIVAVTLASNVLGSINDIRRIADIAHSHGALLVCDATAAAGHIPIDVALLDCDFLFFSGHKMCGPTGIGVLYGKKKHLENLPPGFVGGGIVADVSSKHARYLPPPERFETGTPNISGAIGLGAACHYLSSIGVKTIHEHTQTMLAEAYERLAKIPGITIYAEKNPAKNVGIISFTMASAHAHDVAQILAEHRVAVRAGHHCAMPLGQAIGAPATTRASFYLYNTREDVMLLTDALTEVKTIFG
ncbi:MAG: cysteine desulfurase [Candidatus Lloydbacteria bacterium CG22_combo_CG10-13_8_21_14_all_47_15]|uniref:Cysteine desulfurase n=1 Tax=Candidatus Lloydbacteria bacterium CG22_combo_CG10-13_8_21_14_all_47_15 TaxID=1974635 RepID=A0A2H0CT52_9BACT|nr:MAG: cysteine desulfurase [Candidatus Lloydbacteria bacterium CG22_combo_CG10-13_8_21_14_all_47_15]